MDAERFLRILAEPAYGSLKAGSAAGLMNDAVRAPATEAAGYLTLGAGERLSGVETGQPILLPGARCEHSSACDVYARRVGPVPPGAAALDLGWAILEASVPPEAGRARPGAMAEALRAAGVRVVYAGPVADELRGLATLTACDGHGILYDIQPVPPWRFEDKGRPELIVLDLRPSLPISRERQALDRALSLSRSVSRERDKLIVASPLPGPDRRRLAPVLFWGRGWEGRTLTSATTHTSGLIANIDLAPTILDCFHLEAPVEMGGRPVRPVPVRSLASLEAYAREARVNERALLATIIVWGAYAFLAGVLAVVSLTQRVSAGWLGAARAGLPFLAAVPLAMLIAAGYFFHSAAALVAVIAAAALAIGLACALLGRVAPPLCWMFGLTTVAILADILFGGRRLALSLLSDFPVTGMRFYGIGNEYMGVLIGAGLLVVPWAWQQRGRDRLDLPGWLLAMTLWGVMVFALGWPGLGANFGGALGALVGVLATARLCASGRFRWWDALLALAAVIAAAVLLFWIDAHRPAGAQTHLAGLLRGVRGDPGLFLEVVRRKIGMGIRLLTAVPFVATLVAVAPVLYLWYHAAGARSLAALKQRPLLAAGIGGTLIGAVAALLMNDSGVVPWGVATAAALAAWLDTLLADRLATGEPA
jgi:hypothetical protein